MGDGQGKATSGRKVMGGHFMILKPERLQHVSIEIFGNDHSNPYSFENLGKTKMIGCCGNSFSQ